MLSEITASQLAEWVAFYELEPFGCVAEDIRAARISQAAYAAGGGKATVEDFMPDREGKYKAFPTDEELAKKARRFTLANGGKISSSSGE